MFMASLLTLSASVAHAEEANPNRVLVTDKGGVTKGFVIDYVEDMSFARVDGDVLAEVTVNEVSLTTLRLTIRMTPECRSYRLAVLPQTIANQLGNDPNAIRYINSLPPENVPTLYEDFNNGQLSGIELNPDSKYSVITIGMDMYGVEAGVFRADFETPAPPIVGNPHVDAKLVSKTLDSFTVQFTPNSDVQSYWMVAGEKGTMQAQYEQFAPMFGFSNFNEMIKMWGIEYHGPVENTWNEMAPNTDYEVFVAMTDKKGNFAPYETYEFSTESLGGKGEASVAIRLESFTASDWGGEILPTQAIRFTPNDQASCYRMIVYLASVYDADKEAIQSELCSDPDMPFVGWFQYREQVGEYQLNLSTDYVALAAAKNIDGKWGKVTELRFTTPSTCPGYSPRPGIEAVNTPQRRLGNHPSSLIKAGVIPSINLAPRRVTLEH